MCSPAQTYSRASERVVPWQRGSRVVDVGELGRKVALSTTEE